jgi:hypothetical protein
VLAASSRLAGLQPSRGQITDLLDWFGRRLETLGVEAVSTWRRTADWVTIESAEEVIVATGSRPARSRVPAGRYRWSSGCPGYLTGLTSLAIHDVLDGTAVPGERVLVLDDLSDWRGSAPRSTSPRRATR